MGKLREYNAGDVLYKRGERDDRIFLLYDGAVYLSTYDDLTGELYKIYVKPCEYFGVKTALGGYARDGGAIVASGSASVSEFSVGDFDTFMKTNPKLLVKMLRFFSDELRDLHIKLSKALGLSSNGCDGGGDSLDGGSVAQGIYKEDIRKMTDVARCFYVKCLYESCIGICNIILKKPLDKAQKTTIELLLKSAKDNLNSDEKPTIISDMADERNLYDEHVIPKALWKFERDYKKNDVIMCEHDVGNTFFLIIKGAVELLKVANNERKSIGLYKAGQFFGEIGLLNGLNRMASAVATSDCSCLELDAQHFNVILEESPHLAKDLLIDFCDRVFDAQKWVTVLSCRDAAVKVANALTFICDHHATKKRDNNKYLSTRIDISPYDVASWAALNSEDACKELNHLTKNNTIDIYSREEIPFLYTKKGDQNYIEVHDMATLHRIANRVYYDIT